ncbi:hypothetical protein D3C78_625330 [compost metagenome]
MRRHLLAFLGHDGQRVVSVLLHVDGVRAFIDDDIHIERAESVDDSRQSRRRVDTYLIDREELCHVVIISDANPAFCRPMLLNGEPDGPINPKLPTLVRQEIRAKLGNAALLLDLHRAAGELVNALPHQGRVEAIVLDLVFGILKKGDLPLHFCILGGIVKLRFLRPLRECNHTIRPCSLTTDILNICPGILGDDDATTVKLMQGFRPALVHLVLAGAHVSHETIAVTFMVDVGRIHDVLAGSLALLIDVRRNAVRQNDGAGVNAPMPVTATLVPVIDNADALDAFAFCKPLVVRVRVAGEFGTALKRCPDLRFLVGELLNRSLNIGPLAKPHVTGVVKIHLE